MGTNLSNPSFAEISRTMGGEGIRVTKPEEVGPALTSLIASGKPGVLEIVVSQVYNARFSLQRIKGVYISLAYKLIMYQFS